MNIAALQELNSPSNFQIFSSLLVDKISQVSTPLPSSSMASPLTILLLSLIFLSPLSSSTSDHLNQGSSLSVEAPDNVLVSPGGTFAAGFYPVGENAYCFAVWFSTALCSRQNCTPVWMANRDSPVNGKQSKLSLLSSGDLVLTDAGNLAVWHTDTASASASASAQLNLQENGNLVLQDSNRAVLWQSFSSPTDTLLPLQLLINKMTLVSSRSGTDFSSGFYKFYFDTDNVLHLIYSDADFSTIYWPDPDLTVWSSCRTTYNDSKIAYLDALGNFSSTDAYTFLSADYGNNRIQRRLTMDFDGNLRVYSRAKGSETWYVSWQAIPQQCQIHGSCGSNSVCSYVPSYGRKCECLPGYRAKSNSDLSLGCVPESDLICNQTEAAFSKLEHTGFYGYDLANYPNYTVEMCANLCLQTCSCMGFNFMFEYVEQSGTFCFPKYLLRNGQHAPNFEGDFYLKVPAAQVSTQNVESEDLSRDCSKEQVVRLDKKYGKKGRNTSVRLALWSACVVAAIECIGVALVWTYLMIKSSHKPEATQGYLLAASGYRKFRYAELEKATNGFKEEIGRGSGGIVYKGILTDNRVAAIKRLIDANQGEAEFQAEIDTIGRLNHINLIDMWGYCSEGKHRLLVFEYLEHGSLAKTLSSQKLDWKRRHQIAVGTAKGLAYLHEECLEWVLHCDIKPQNILIDSNYEPKVSDFGLSRLLTRGDVQAFRVSQMVGTRGYMAPEWLLNLPITSKVDVYSFGIVLLEMVTGMNPAVGGHPIDGVSEKEQRTLVEWVKEQMFGESEATKWIEKITDPNLEGKYDAVQLETLVTVAVQCVQEDKDARPTMGQIVKMLLLHQ